MPMDMAADEMVVWDGRIARLRRPFQAPQYGGPMPDFGLANSPRSLQTATRLGPAAGHTGEITRVPAEARVDVRPSALEQRAADQARSTRRGATGSVRAMRSPRALQPLALDATWLAPEQRDLLAYMDERIRETQQRIQSGAKHTERISADASSTRAWHDSGRCLQVCSLPTPRPLPPRVHVREACCLSCQMALPKLRALSKSGPDVTIDDIVVEQLASRATREAEQSRRRTLKPF